MSSYLGYCIVFLCIFTCIASQSSITPKDQVADKGTVDKASAKDSTSLNENKNSSYVDKKNDKTQVIKQLSTGLNATNPNDSTSATPSTVSSSTEIKPTSSVISDVKNEFTGNRNIGAGAVIRGFYVFVGLGAIVVMYIVVRTIRLKRKKTTVRKYGVLTNREDVEMTPLGAEDEEEESTLFDMTKSRP